MNNTKNYPPTGGLPGFTLTRKNIKRIHLRVSDSGEIQISAPMRAALSDIRKMMSTNIDWINNAVSRSRQRTAARPKACDGGSVVIAGHSYPLRVTAGGRTSCGFSGTTVEVKAVDPQDNEIVASAIERFLRKQAQSLFEESLERMYPLVESLGAPMPEIRIRKMTSRWGTCNVKTKVITLNLCLARAPMPLIDSVVLHELIHLVNFPHDERFHAISSSLMPDYRQRRRLLNSLDIIY